MNQKELRKQVPIIAIILEMNDDHKDLIFQKKSFYDDYKTKRNYLRNRENTVKLIFSWFILFTVFISFVALIFMTVFL
jgi:hypothetical protein